MKKTTLAIACVFGCLAARGRADDAKVEYKPMAIGALHEFGMITKGIYAAGSPNVPTELVENDWLDHFGAFLTKEAIVNGRLHLTGGLGGIFQFRKPELPGGGVNPGFSGAQRKGFFVGPTDAQAVYHFGPDPDQPMFKLGAGMFFYKYNPQAYNLGEYLFRSGPYPTYITTGGYSIVNSAAANMQGMKASMSLGGLRGDLFLTTETNLAPLYDWSVAGVFSYTAGNGLLELGAGVNFKRLLQVKPSRTTQHVSKNSYVTYTDTITQVTNTYAGSTDYYSVQESFNANRKDRALALGDTVTAARYAAEEARFGSLADTVDAILSMPASKRTQEYFTAAGTMLMGRFSIDPKKLFGGDGVFGPQDLKLYGEIGVLGVKNYPIFYTKVTERMPMMAGFNFPGFRLLDLIAVQVETYKSPWLNNTSQITKGGADGGSLNLPAFPLANDDIPSEKAWNDLATKDDFKWSVLIQRKLGTHITLSGQVASDHMRLTSSYFYYGPQFDHNEVTAAGDNWYWTQVAWGI